MRFSLLFLYPIVSFSMTTISHKSNSYYVDNWSTFHKKVSNKMNEHPIIKNNNYTKQFAKGDAPLIEQQVLIQQFSVFNKWFLVAQLLKIINTPDIYEMQIGNEKYNIINSHFEWLIDLAYKLGLSYKEIGKREYGSLHTLYLCDELKRLYGSDDLIVSAAAAYAYETWVQTNFWDEIIVGFEKINKKRLENGQSLLPLYFWTYNSRIEKQNMKNTVQDLKKMYVNGYIHDEQKFIYICLTMLDAIDVFWSNLNKTELCKLI